jgi:hypothetical protein
VRHGVAALLTMALLLALVCLCSSLVLEYKSLVYHGLEIFKVTRFQSIGKSIIQAVEKILLLLLISIHIIESGAGKLCETSNILAHCHRSLLQIMELLLLELDNTLRYMMRSKGHLEHIPVDDVRFFISFYICILPISCGAHKLNLLLYCLELVIGFHGV